MDDLLIAQALDDCLNRLPGDGLEVCLARYPQYRTSLEPLLRVAAGLDATVARISPRPAARSAIRDRVMAAAAAAATAPIAVPVQPVLGGAVSCGPPRLVALSKAKAETSHSAAGRSGLQPWRAVAAAVMLLAGSLAFSYPVAAASLPGDPLYGEKLAIESMRVSLANTPSARVAVHLDLASQRAAEVRALVAKGRADLAPAALDNMAAHTEAGLLALESVAPGQDSALLRRLNQTADQEATALATVQPVLTGNAAGSTAFTQAQVSLNAGRQVLAGLATPTTVAPTATQEAAATDTPAAASVLAPTDTPDVPTEVAVSDNPPATATLAFAATPAGRNTPGPKQTPPGRGGRTPGPQRTPVPPVTPPGQVGNTPGPHHTPVPLTTVEPPGLTSLTVTPGSTLTPTATSTEEPTAEPTKPPQWGRTPGPHITPPVPGTATAVAGTTPPGPQSTPPGQVDHTPGPQSTPPGQVDRTPGPQSTPPGQGDRTPGPQSTPPGQGDRTPGPQATPPGQVDRTPGPQSTPPGQVDRTPGPQPGGGPDSGNGANGGGGNDNK